jgi:hypothetical protein
MPIMFPPPGSSVGDVKPRVVVAPLVAYDYSYNMLMFGECLSANRLVGYDGFSQSYRLLCVCINTQWQQAG